MSPFLLPASCRCPQRSMLSHFAAVKPSQSASRVTTTLAPTTAAARRCSSTSSSTTGFSADMAESSFFLLNANASQAESKIFAPGYLLHAQQPFPYQYQSVHYARPSAFPQSQPKSLEVFPSHQQRVRQQTSLKSAAYAHRTIPLMFRAPSSPSSALPASSLPPQQADRGSAVKTTAPAPSDSSDSILRASLPAMLNQDPWDITFNHVFMDMARMRLCRERIQCSHEFDYCQDKPLREAAVMMPLCVVKGVPSILFTVRSNTMRNHRGECSFPGGKRDSSDKTCLETALREMQEEIGIHPTDVEVLGEYSPVPNKDGTMRVQPYVGFVKTPLENLDILPFNRDEVQRVFAIPIAELLSMEKRTKLARFRDSKYLYPVYESACEDGCTVWGLTAFILDGVLRRIMSAGPTGALVCPEDLKIQRYRPPTFSAAYTSPVATSASSPAGPAAAQSFA